MPSEKATSIAKLIYEQIMLNCGTGLSKEIQIEDLADYLDEEYPSYGSDMATVAYERGYDKGWEDAKVEENKKLPQRLNIEDIEKALLKVYGKDSIEAISISKYYKKRAIKYEAHFYLDEFPDGLKFYQTCSIGATEQEAIQNLINKIEELPIINIKP